METLKRLLLWKSAKTGSALPAEYQRVDYIVGKGTQSYFDTGIAGGTDGLRFELCFELSQFSQYRALFGNYVNESTNCWRLILQSTDNGKYFFTTGNSANTSKAITAPGGVAIGKKTYAKIDASRAEMMIGGAIETAAGGGTAGTENTSNIALGNNSAKNGAGIAPTKFWYFKIWSGDTMLRNFVPCYRKSDNKAGMYDTVGGSFYYSEGAEEFSIPA